MNESEDVDSVSIDSSFKILYLGKEERITCEIDVFNWCEDNNCVGLISGSGASLLVISDREIENDFKGFELIKLKVDCDGVKVW